MNFMVIKTYWCARQRCKEGSREAATWKLVRDAQRVALFHSLLKTYRCSPEHTANEGPARIQYTVNVWFPFMYYQKCNCYFQNRIIMFCLPVPTLIYLWEICIFPGSVCLSCCREICGSFLGIYKSLTDTWMWKLGLRLRNSQKRNT